MQIRDFKTADQYGKWCGKWALKGRALDKSETLYTRMSCKCWHCAYCGPRKAGRYKHAIIKAAELHDLTRFLTLTLDPERVSGDPIKYMRKCFDKFRTYLRRKHGHAIKYIAVVEFHENGMPHMHLIIDRYEEWNWLRRAWESCGGGSHVHIQKICDAGRVGRYLSKYLTKDLFLAAPASQRTRLGRIIFRRVTVSRGIKLNEKLPKSHNWLKLAESIRTVFVRHHKAARNVELDENDKLLAFVCYRDTSQRLGESASEGWWFLDVQ